jgi:hypothetical protein
MLSLSDHQAKFLEDVCYLVMWAHGNNLKLTGGELYRNPALQQYYVQAGLSWTNNSRHSDRLAVDLNLFSGGFWEEGRYQGGSYKTDTESYRELGRVWESLSPHNVWAVRKSSGVLTDGNHFERRTTHRTMTRDEEESIRSFPV